MNTTLLDELKKVLGYYNTNFDGIIEKFIGAGKKDLVMAGIHESRVDESDPLIFSALYSYVLSMIDTYEFRELSASAYALQKDELRHHIEYLTPAPVPNGN